MQACGVCHTDLHYREGGINDDFPFLLGHEAAGIVEAVGANVTDVVPGDFVILNWRAVCGTCRACRRGEPWYCFSTFNADATDDARPTVRSCPLHSASARSPRRRSCMPGSARRSTRPSSPAVAGLLGCGVMAGLGAAINTGACGAVRPSPSSAAVASVPRRSPARAWPAQRRSSRVDVDDRKLATARRPRRDPHRELRATPTPSRRSANSPAVSAPTS